MSLFQGREGLGKIEQEEELDREAALKRQKLEQTQITNFKNRMSSQFNKKRIVSQLKQCLLVLQQLDESDSGEDRENVVKENKSFSGLC